MTDNRSDGPNVTVVERRGGGGGLIIGLVLLVGIVIGAFFLLNQSKNDNLRTDAVTSAAGKVGDAAKDVGESAKKAAE